MKNKGLLLAFVAMVIVVVAGTADAQTTEESLRKNFPQIKFEKVNPSPIKGIYEIIMSDGVLYYAPESQYIISGNIFSKEGRNLTQEKQMEINRKNLELIKEKQKEIPLDRKSVV
jgi:thiol:disulfide interchange protein DsbC